jgi:AAA15 family ATPase/GTPase
MLTEIKYKNLFVDKLSRINLICGENGVGKTDLLKFACSNVEEISGESRIRLSETMRFIASNENKILGIENFLEGIHPSMLPKQVLCMIVTAVNFNNQLFVTSHNIDVIKAVCNINDSKIITLVINNKNELAYRSLSGERVLEAMEDYGLDPRF